MSTATSKRFSYGQLIGGKKFNVKITATGTGWDMKVAPEVSAKDVKDHKVVGTSQKRIDLPAKLTGEFTYANDVRSTRNVARSRGSPADDHIETGQH